MIRVSKDEDCPTQSYESGEPNGKCWGDGHYLCKKCKHYREDFNRLGQDYIDFAHTPRIHVSSMDDYEFNLHKHWKDEDQNIKHFDDDYDDGNIKHFQD